VYIFVYTTVPNINDAKKIAKILLEKKLAACINMFQIASMYIYNGNIKDENEVGMIIKTKSEKFKELKNELKKIHPYKTPCICSIHLEECHRDFLDWIDKVLA